MNLEMYRKERDFHVLIFGLVYNATKTLKGFEQVKYDKILNSLSSFK